MVTNLTEADFEKAISSSIPIIVDFWAEWCGPCKRLSPVFESLAPTYEGKLRFGKVNVEQNQPLGGKHSIQAIPCMILFKDGKEVNRLVGAMPPDSLKKKIDEMLAMVR
ncbi:thioredoxin [Candidatus Woesearchaeota archaeon]|nr:thioredoxin [Candidatus Woesearchaeota archaeon]